MSILCARPGNVEVATLCHHTSHSTSKMAVQPTKIVTVTEARSELTRDIDVESPAEIVRTLRNCDAQIFSGYRSYENIFECDSVSTVANVIADVLRTDGMVIMIGAGTSGRLAHFVCSSFNQHLVRLGRPPRFFHSCAGGDDALLYAQESAEDASKQAVEDFERVRNEGRRHGGPSKNCLVGITCGFTATYVGAQVEHALDRSVFPDDGDEVWSAVVLGFNPLETVRTIRIDGWSTTFKAVLANMHSDPRGYILSPTLGPEAITGSTRMKGGSGTKIVLESIIAASCKAAFSGTSVATDNTATIHNHFLQFQQTMSQTYLQSSGTLPNMIEAAGRTLRSKRNIIYLSNDRAFGCLGVVDASECPPTYGASFHDVQGFLEGGWDTMMEGVVLKSPTPKPPVASLPGLSLDAFRQSVVPTLTCGDFVVLLLHGNKLSESLKRDGIMLQNKGITLGVVSISYENEPPTWWDLEKHFPQNMIVRVGLKEMDILPGVSAFAEFACKLILNAISTGGHVLKGTTVSNLMVSLRISNAKLFDRAIGLLMKLVNSSLSEEGKGGDALLTEKSSEKYIKKAIYGEIPSPSKVVADHVAVALGMAQPIVPIAYLMCVGKMTQVEAMDALALDTARRVLLRVSGDNKISTLVRTT